MLRLMESKDKKNLRIKRQEINVRISGQMIFRKVPRLFSGERMVIR